MNSVEANKPFLPTPFEREQSEYRRFSSSLIRTAIIINFLVAVIALLGLASPAVSFLLACILLMYLLAKAVHNPRKLFFLFFGIKITLDTLWWLSPTEEEFIVRITELSFVPLAVCAVLGLMYHIQQNKSITWMFLLFAIWCTIIQLFYREEFKYVYAIKLSGSFMGLALGQCFLSRREDLILIFKLLFVSTLIPVAAGVLQVFVDYAFGIEIFFITGGDRFRSLEHTRGVRYSGLFYESATAGMCSLVTVVSAVGILHTGQVKRWGEIGFGLAITAATFLCIQGATRSIIVLIGCVLVGFAILNFRKTLFILPLVMIMLIGSWQKFESVVNRVNKEITASDIDFEFGLDANAMLHDQNYRTMFTGRVGLWQDTVAVYESGSLVERLFGTGIGSNAHSSYFFLLLYLGICGLLYYLFIHILLLARLFRSRRKDKLRIVAIGSLFGILLLGISTTAVVYTSIQWIVYLIVGGAIRSDHMVTRHGNNNT